MVLQSKGSRQRMNAAEAVGYCDPPINGEYQRSKRERARGALAQELDTLFKTPGVCCAYTGTAQGLATSEQPGEGTWNSM